LHFGRLTEFESLIPGHAVSLGETVTDVRILKVPLNGGTPETVLSLPFDEVGSVAMFPDARRFLCTVYAASSDVWVVEHFDVGRETTSARRGGMNRND
jgi:hypothetical protein